MDEDFETFSNREDPILARLFVYAFGTSLAIVAAGGLMFLAQSGVFSRSLAKRNMRDVEGSNKRILFWTKVAAIAGAGGGIYYSIRAELNIQLKAREANKR